MEIIGVSLNAIIASSRTQALLEESQRLAAELQNKSGELQTQQRELQQSNAELEEKASLLAAAEPCHRDQEPRDRGRPPRARGPGRAARAVVALQVRVPREHVARAAHAAQLAADPGQAARRQHRRQPQRAAGRVRADHPQRGHGPAAADQRHPRPVQGRGGQDGRPPRRRRRLGDRRVRRGDVQAADRREGPRFSRRGRRGRAADRWSPTSTGCSRCCATCCRTRSSSPRPARSGWPSAARADERFTTPALDGRRRGAGVRGHRHRHRHPARAAAHDLRGLPAGGRHDQPQVRRHRARASRSAGRSRG